MSVVLIDFDDTLVDNSVVPETVRRACAAIAETMNGVTTKQLLAANGEAFARSWQQAQTQTAIGELEMDDHSRELWRLTLASVGETSSEAVAAAFETHQAIVREMTCLFDDARPFLDALRAAGVKVALVTNSSPRSQRSKIRDVGLADAFDEVVISGALGIAKPDPAIFHHALDRLGADADAAVHIGDSLSTDVEGANAAGVRSIWLNRADRERRDTDAAPHRMVRSLMDVLDQIQALRTPR